MIYDYVVTIKNTNRKVIDFFSLSLLAIAVVNLVRAQLIVSDSRIPYFYLLCILIIAIAGWNIYQQRTKGKTAYYSRALFAAAVGWALVPDTGFHFRVLLVPYVLLALVERTAKKPIEIGFTLDHIIINQLFRRTYNWTDFSNIVLKDDLLTLDFKNNRLWQMETVNDDHDAEEDEFNQYCSEQLAQASTG